MDIKLGRPVKWSYENLILIKHEIKSVKLNTKLKFCDKIEV